jgi:hypothetical protein
MLHITVLMAGMESGWEWWRWSVESRMALQSAASRVFRSAAAE